MRARELVGEKVIALDGESVGIVEDLEIGEDWKVTGLIVRLEREVAKKLGSRFGFKVKGKIPVDLIQGTKNFITLSLDGDELYSRIEKL